MKLRLETMRDGRIKLKIVRYFRKPDGKSSCTTVRVLGFKDELEKEVADPIAWGEGIAREMTDAHKARNGHAMVDIDLSQKLEGIELTSSDSWQRKNIGYAAFSHIYHLLEMDQFWKDRKARRGFRFDVEAVFRLLVYNRLLIPSSKKRAWEDRGFFFEPFNFTLDNIYDSLSFFNSYKEDFVRRIDDSITRKVGRNKFHFYYDVTNYYFEIDDNDEDMVDLDGNVVGKGLRKKGCSKEHRSTPIVQMGLFMDDNGLPVDYELFSGNTHDSKTFLPSVDHVTHHMEGTHIIFVADKGMMGGDNISELLAKRQGYIISNSVRKADAAFKEYVLDEGGYTELYDGETGELVYKYKERTVPRRIRIGVKDPQTDRPTGAHTTQLVNERQIVMWSRKYAERERQQREKVLEKTRRLVGSSSSKAEILTFGSRKYIRKTPVIDGRQVLPDDYILELDEGRVDDEERLDGYYFVSTNVVGFDMNDRHARQDDPCSYRFFFNHGDRTCYWRDDNFLVINRPMPPESIMEQYHGLWRIEESFRVTKSDLAARPVHVSLEDHIRAHFLICFTALVLMRVLQFRLGWKYSASVIQDELRKACGTNFAQNYYVFDHSSETLKELGDCLGIDFSRKFMEKQEMRKLLGETKKTV